MMIRQYTVEKLIFIKENQNGSENEEEAEAEAVECGSNAGDDGFRGAWAN